jgi:hypothetical protein
VGHLVCAHGSVRSALGLLQRIIQAGGTQLCTRRLGAGCKVTRNAGMRNQFAVNERLRHRNTFRRRAM